MLIQAVKVSAFSCLTYNLFKMGCCASQKSQAHGGQDKAEPNQPTVATNANTSINNQVVTESAHPQQPPNPIAPPPPQQIPSAITVATHINDPLKVSHQEYKSAVVGSNVSPIQPANSSALNGIYQTHSITNGKEHHSNVVAREASKVIVENPVVQSNVSSILKNSNEPPWLVELDHAKEFASHTKANAASKIHEKVHGEEQVLETYHQNFEIPIFEVALTAH